MAGGPRRSEHYGAMRGVALGADVTKACFLVGASKEEAPGINLH